MYWIVDDDEVNEDDEDWDKESERGDGMGEGAQWTVFFVPGVAAMRVNVKGASLPFPTSHANHVLASSKFKFKFAHSAIAGPQ
jgi:hypothetical protein